MPTKIINSPDITSLASKVTVDLCAGNFIIDVTPSDFIAGRIYNLEGASVEVINSVGVTIRSYITSGYDIIPPMTGSVSVGVPLLAQNFLYGDYKINVKLTDSEGNEYIDTHLVNICPTDKKDRNVKVPCLNASINGNCKDGKVVIILNQVPNYKGVMVSSQINDITVDYPTGSELPPEDTAMGSFSLRLFEGVYKVSGTICATYVSDDNVIYKIPYKIKCQKDIKCVIDECCIQDRLKELNDKLKTDCTDTSKNETTATIINVLFLYQAAKGAANCGEDPSEFISELEDILGCSCTCNCNEGTPIINNAPATDYNFTGCGFDVNTTGNTKEINILNYSYKLLPGDKSGFVVSDPVIDEEECTVTQTVVSTSGESGSLFYKAILNQIDNQPLVANVLKNTLGGGFTYGGSSGDYSATFTGISLNPLKTLITIGTYDGSVITANYSDTHEIKINTNGDNRLINVAFIVEVIT